MCSANFAPMQYPTQTLGPLEAAASSATAASAASVSASIFSGVRLPTSSKIRSRPSASMVSFTPAR